MTRTPFLSTVDIPANDTKAAFEVWKESYEATGKEDPDLSHELIGGLTDHLPFARLRQKYLEEEKKKERKG